MTQTHSRAPAPRREWRERFPIWLTGISLATALLLIVALLGFIAAQGLGVFWPRPLWRVTLDDGSALLGIVHRTERIPGAQAGQRRTLWRTANRDLSGADFVWVDDPRVARTERPGEAVYIERLEWGPFVGFIEALVTPEGRVSGPNAWPIFRRLLPGTQRRLRAIRTLERRRIGDVHAQLEARRLDLRRWELSAAAGRPDARRIDKHRAAIQALQARYAALAEELERRRAEDAAYRVVLADIDGKTKDLSLSAVVRAHRPNKLSWPGRVAVYASRVAEFVFGQPREANSEGGVAPAIFGTVMMTLLMSVVAVPLGVLASLYLHEYARQGWMVSVVRIAVNNLAGVPSIVFGVFGLGFFCYLIGGTIDRVWFAERLPAPTFGGGGILWAALTLALLTVPVVIVATEEALAAVPDGLREASLACGATRFQTIWRVVLPSAVPGILTGAILAMARGAGEVAPLMITGVVKLAPELPLDHLPPFLHLERKFMHLGFHVYDVGFQSPNIEASKAMVYMTTLLLLGIIIALNLAAMQIRGRLRRQLRGAEV